MLEPNTHPHPDEPTPRPSEHERAGRSRRTLRRFLFGIATLAVLLLISHLCTMTVGVFEVQEAIRAEANSTVNIEDCHAVLPGLIYCRYTIIYGMEGRSQYESMYFWYGFNMKRVRHELGLVS
jgi:hypothetical protein